MERDGEKGGAGGERAMHGMWDDEHGDEDQRRTTSERKCEGDLESRRVFRKTRIEIEMRDKR